MAVQRRIGDDDWIASSCFVVHGQRPEHRKRLLVFRGFEVCAAGGVAANQALQWTGSARVSLLSGSSPSSGLLAAKILREVEP